MSRYMTICFAFIMALALQTAQAEDKISYFGISLIQDIELDWNDSDFGKNTGDYGLGFLYGHKLNDTVSAEVFYGDSKIDKNSIYGPLNMDIELVEFALVANVETHGSVSPFARLAYIDLEIRGDSVSCFENDDTGFDCEVETGSNASSSWTDLVFGLGMDFAIDQNNSLRLLQTFGDIESATDLTYLSLGWLSRF